MHIAYADLFYQINCWKRWHVCFRKHQNYVAGWEIF